MQIPDSIKKIAQDPEIFTICEQIGNVHGLHIDQIGELDSEIRGVLLGVNKSSDFTKHVIERLEIDHQTAEKITKEINEAVGLFVKEQSNKKPEKPAHVEAFEKAADLTLEQAVHSEKDYKEIMQQFRPTYEPTVPKTPSPQPLPPVKPIIQEPKPSSLNNPSLAKKPPTIAKPVYERQTTVANSQTANNRPAYEEQVPSNLPIGNLPEESGQESESAQNPADLSHIDTEQPSAMMPISVPEVLPIKEMPSPIGVAEEILTVPENNNISANGGLKVANPTLENDIQSPAQPKENLDINLINRQPTEKEDPTLSQTPTKEINIINQGIGNHSSNLVEKTAETAAPESAETVEIRKLSTPTFGTNTAAQAPSRNFDPYREPLE